MQSGGDEMIKGPYFSVGLSDPDKTPQPVHIEGLTGRPLPSEIVDDYIAPLEFEGTPAELSVEKPKSWITKIPVIGRLVEWVADTIGKLRSAKKSLEEEEPRPTPSVQTVFAPFVKVGPILSPTTPSKPKGKGGSGSSGSGQGGSSGIPPAPSGSFTPPASSPPVANVFPADSVEGFMDAREWRHDSLDGIDGFWDPQGAMIASTAYETAGFTYVSRFPANALSNFAVQGTWAPLSGAANFLHPLTMATSSAVTRATVFS